MEVIISRSAINEDENTYRGKIVQILDSEDYNASGIIVKLHTGRIGHVVTVIEDVSSNLSILEQKIFSKEGKNLELKSSLYYDFNLSTSEKPIKNEELIIAVAEEVASIMNSIESCSIIIGVKEKEGKDNVVHGLSFDYRVINDGQGGSDKFKLFLKSKLEKYLKNKIIFDLINIKIHEYAGKEICEIVVSPSPIPICVNLEKTIKIKKNDPVTDEIKWIDQSYVEIKCYVRVDNEKMLYTIPDFLNYWIRQKASQISESSTEK